ncbi:aromatic ring-hydroxylating dioxygenase subunit alpha [Croceicoccus bisphenolivorans]|uniref:aromatic ring-hydroxylating dioxygenase subunit alpha n=1 Tax=Croceicoccus bisphenolivorans TaxID=1783232 RepID=UPI00082D6913|nr:aromatic ring-hydroxylating dioxygenase subunit alpha [Croceicoccus bisphenolivorans]
MNEAKELAKADAGFAKPRLPIGPATSDAKADAAMGPMIFSAWYVIAKSTDVGDTLTPIRVLGEPLVHFRKADGTPVVLDDRCAHRRYPLSRGKRVGDTIECGYHGFTYESSGKCIWAPGARADANLNFGVRAYPCAERGPWLWVWMGPPEQADPQQIPMPDMLDRPDDTVCGYKLNPCNYLMLIENLLDLSHLHFVHDAADRDSVSVVPEDAPAPPDGVAWRKVVEEAEVLLAAHFAGGDPKRRVRQEDGTTQFGPSLCFGYQRRDPLPDDDTPVVPALIQIAHAVTPLDERQTHQFFMTVISDPLVVEPAQMLHVLQEIVFEQDVEVVAEVQANVDADRRQGRTEVNMPYDRFGLRMRRILADMKAREIDYAASSHA